MKFDRFTMCKEEHRDRTGLGRKLMVPLLPEMLDIFSLYPNRNSWIWFDEMKSCEPQICLQLSS